MKVTYATLRLADLPTEGNRPAGLYWMCGPQVLGRNVALAAILNQFEEADPPFAPVQIAGSHPGTGEPTFVLLRTKEVRERKKKRFMDDEDDERDASGIGQFPTDVGEHYPKDWNQSVREAGEMDRDPTPYIPSMETTPGTEIVPRPARRWLTKEKEEES